ncbi:MAG: hypothetical protein ACQCXQ_12720 [Verrucomicrobiales bacterium]
MTLRELIQPDRRWLDRPDGKRVVWVAGAAALGLACYGFSVGIWRAPLMGVYVAVKLPLLVLLTLVCNGLLNGLLGILLGSGLGFRQSLFALLSAFALVGVILGSLVPVTLLLAWNAPPPDSAAAATSHASYLVCHTLLIAIAGIVANIHLYRLLAVKAASPAAASATLLAWLGGNGFLGAQFSWILRPFFGSPGLHVQFLREDPMRGNFYQTVWRSLERITDGNALPCLIAIGLIAAVPVINALRQQHQK